MTSKKLADAVREVRNGTSQRVLVEVAQAALNADTDEALIRALVTVHEVSETWYARRIADAALGLVK
jgi:hypothetical protein